MNEVNAISTSEGDKTPPATGCPDAKREGSQAMDSSAAPLPGRRCPACTGHGTIFHGTHEDTYTVECPFCQGTGERSGPGNDKDQAQNGRA